MNVVRAYIKGFVVQPLVTNSSLSGKNWTFDYLPANVHWDMLVSDEFYPPTSNVYSLDRVFDLSGSFSYVSGSPVPTVLNFGLMFVPGEFDFRLGTSAGDAGDPAETVDLPTLDDYWLPE